MLSMASTWPSCPQAAISSSPLLSRTVQTAPASLRMSPKAAICTKQKQTEMKILEADDQRHATVTSQGATPTPCTEAGL